MKRVTFLNRCYWPDAEATGQLLSQLCEFLAPRWDVSVVAGQPNWDIGSSEFARAGAQQRKGVQIQRLRHSTLNKGSRAGRLLNLASFTWSVRHWARRTTDRPDVIVCETDPFFLPLVAAPLARKHGARLVFYLQDIYPDIAIAVGAARDSWLVRRLRQRLLKAYSAADAIVVLDEDMRDRLVGWGLPPDKFRIVPNWMDCQAVQPVKQDNGFRRREGLDDRFVVMHSGNMGMTQRLDMLVAAMQQPTTPEQAVLAMVGNGARRESLEQAAAGQANIRFFGYQPRSVLSESLSAADLHVISTDARITGCLAPSKLYGILASGTPVLAVVPEGSAVWRLVEEESVGWTVAPGDPATVAERIAEAAATSPAELEAMGRRARKLAELRYDREICCGTFERVLDEVVGKRRVASSGQSDASPSRHSVESQEIQ